MNIQVFGTLVMIGIFLGSQSPSEQGPAVLLARAEAQWQSRGLTSYKFGVILTCFCSPKGMSFRVVDGKPQLPRDADASTQRFHESWGTIESLFARIRRVIDNGGHRVVVKYHAELGYPIWADLDPRRNVIDDEVFFRVTGFEPSQLAGRRLDGQRGVLRTGSGTRCVTAALWPSMPSTLP